jgi:hypothetical protein
MGPREPWNARLVGGSSAAGARREGAGAAAGGDRSAERRGLRHRAAAAGVEEEEERARRSREIIIAGWRGEWQLVVELKPRGVVGDRQARHAAGWLERKGIEEEDGEIFFFFLFSLSPFSRRLIAWAGLELYRDDLMRNRPIMRFSPFAFFFCHCFMQTAIFLHG